MPIYEYRRPDGSTFEVLQSFTDEPLEQDPQTGVPVERVLHAPAVHFKGKGFYNTDYGTRKRQRESAASSGEGSSSGGASENGSSPGSEDGSKAAASDKAGSGSTSSSESSPGKATEKKNGAGGAPSKPKADKAAA